MSRKILLTQGKFALVDDEDFECLSQWKWRYDNGYASRSVRKGKKVSRFYMHRLIGDIPKDMKTDHINGNPLDNRRSNIRPCTPSQNGMNQHLVTGRSKHKGIYFFKQNKKWVARIMKEGKRTFLGSFNYEKEAAKAYNVAATELFGKFARLNTI